MGAGVDPPLPDLTNNNTGAPLNTKPFHTRVEALEVHERAIIALYGSPARPVVIPLANVDAAPVESISGRRVYDLTMDRAQAVEYGLDI